MNRVIKIFAIFAVALLLVPEKESQDVEPGALLSPPSYGEFMDASSGKDRCTVSHCLCKVRPGKINPISPIEISTSRSMSTYFSENSDVVTDSNKSKIKEFASSQSSKSISLIGYTDGCGSKAHNRALAASRAQNIKETIKQSIPGARIEVIIVGEKTSGHSPESRRVDIIFHSNRLLTTKIEKIPADVYLIDASGSMWSEWRKWTDAVSASFKPGSKIYLSIMSGCYAGQSLDTVSPKGGTEIWYSYWKVLDYMNEGETLLIISDFDSRIPLTAAESSAISKKVRDKNITVKTLR